MAQGLTWKDPRPVAEWWWMDIEEINPKTGDMIRYGRVSWNRDGSGLFSVSLTCEREGCGFYCWPDFRNLSDAQDFVEQLMPLPYLEIEQRARDTFPEVRL